MTRRRALALLLVIAIAAGIGTITMPYAHGLSLVMRAADLQGFFRQLAEFDADAVTYRDLEIPVMGAALRARAYEPSDGAARTIVLITGVHPAGIDEPRLMRLARELAASGVGVVTPEIPELQRFAITPAITDMIEQSATWVASQTMFAPDGRVGLIGVSFSGGLSMVAAGRPGLRDRLAFVLTFGGHADLPRVLRYLCTGVEPPPPDSASALRQIRLQPGPGSAARDPFSQPPPPHDYGVALILLGAADQVVPAAQAPRLREAVRRFLMASALDREDKVKAAAEFAALREVAKTLPEPSATLLRYVNDRDAVHLGARLLPYISLLAGHPALSAERTQDKPVAPVFLLHGIQDNVIPAAESAHLAAALRGTAPVRLLLTDLISHADADQPARVGSVLALASFWGDLLNR
jgi:dienelactone hydrolase